MVKARSWFGLFPCALVALAATAGCGGTNSVTNGSAGSSPILSAGSGGDGDSVKGGAGGGVASGGASGSLGKAGSGGTSGSVGAAGNGGATTVDGVLGGKCTSDPECGTGLVCLTPSSTALNGGGPAGGMCTLACTSTADCNVLSPNSDCFNFGTEAAPKLYCLDGCTVGGTDATTAATKCQGRGDFACVDLSTTAVPEAFCIPLCRSDIECGTGLYCDKGSGLCSSTKATGDPVGTACTPGATVDTCEGFCLRTSADGVTPVTGVCSEFCAGLLDCMYTGDKPGGLCGGPLSDNFGILDLGYCLPNCKCTGDCVFPGDMCRAWAASEQDFATDLGSPGLCYPNVTGSVELTTCN